jgi:predicted nuclease with TOPRIM domain
MFPAYSFTYPVGHSAELNKFVMQRIHLRNEAKTTTLEKLVPHLGTLEATRTQLHETRELARKTEHDLRDRIAELQDSNFELSGSSKGIPYP